MVGVGVVIAAATTAGANDLTQQGFQNREIPDIEKDDRILFFHVLIAVVHYRLKTTVHS